MTDNYNAKILPFEFRVLVKKLEVLKTDEVFETFRKNLLNLGKARITEIKVKKYGFLFIGKGPIGDLLRAWEICYHLTQSGELEMVYTIDNIPTYYIKDGLIHDLRKEEPEEIKIPVFDEEHEPDEADFERMGF